MHFIGVDIGSSCAKTAVIDDNESIIFTDVQPTGWNSTDTAEEIAQKLTDAGFVPSELPCVSTGYGRSAVKFADKSVTEITCHAQGAALIFKASDFAVIDIGGQDTKIIIAENGSVSDFFMNDKCSAGTGRFLEVMAATLGLPLTEMCQLAEKGSGVVISSMCTVFAESEVIGLIGRGEKKENIAGAVIDSIVKKTAAQTGRFNLEDKRVFLTGGLCECTCIHKALERELGLAVEVSPLGRWAGAAGAACQARKLYENGKISGTK